MKKSLVVFGPGCARCVELTRRVEDAARALGIEYELIKMTNINSYAVFGVTMTPALMVDDELRIMGKVPSVDELRAILQMESPS